MKGEDLSRGIDCNERCGMNFVLGKDGAITASVRMRNVVCSGKSSPSSPWYQSFAE